MTASSALLAALPGDRRVRFGGMVLESGAVGSPREIRMAEFQQVFDDTVGFWRSWLSRSTYQGRWRETVQRSAITLKLMTYAPSGGLVAVPMTGLPEQAGGEQWDFRYTSVRDASFSVYALLRLGFTEQSAQFSAWLRDRVTEQVGGEGPAEHHVPGRRIVRPERGVAAAQVRLPRVATGAEQQRRGRELQLDIYGVALDSIWFADERGLQVGRRGWTAMRDLLDWLAANWDRPEEEGIWETRGRRKDFTYGRLMSCIAFDRGLRLAAAHGDPATSTAGGGPGM